jgi:beta-galactosidase
MWLNGFFLGNNKSGYVGAAYDVTDYIHFDKDNVIVVRADASQYEGWFYEGAGIYRHVWLNTYQNVNITKDGVFAYSNIKGDVATVTIETSLQNQELTTAGCSVYSYITDRNGKKISSVKRTNPFIAGQWYCNRKSKYGSCGGKTMVAGRPLFIPGGFHRKAKWNHH